MQSETREFSFKLTGSKELLDSLQSQIDEAVKKTKPAYVITAYRHRQFGSVWKLQSDGLYALLGGTGEGTLNSTYFTNTSMVHAIYSVMRLSDDVEFMVGDNITHPTLNGIHKISSIAFSGREIVLHVHSVEINLHDRCIKKAKVILTTRDGVAKQAGDYVYVVDISVPKARLMSDEPRLVLESWIRRVDSVIDFDTKAAAIMFVNAHNKVVLTTVDGVEKSIGDNAYVVVKPDADSKWQLSVGIGKIDSYWIRPSDRHRDFHCKIAAERWIEQNNPKPLVTTEDGKEYFASEANNVINVYSVLPKGSWELKSHITVKQLSLYSGYSAWKHFSTWELRDQYVRANKPVLSYNDIAPYLQVGTDANQALRNLINNRI